MTEFKAWTDGSCKGNGKDGAAGGYAYLLFENGVEVCRGAKGVKNTTNNRMEITAILEALNEIENRIEDEDYSIKIFTDSAYCKNCYSQKWYKKWELNGWKNAKKEPVKNRDLWEKLVPFFELKNFSLEKVKGHSGGTENEKINEIVDGLAQCVAEEIAKEDIC